MRFFKTTIAFFEWFQTTVGVMQGCILSPRLFNVFLEKIMIDALDGFNSTVNINGRTILNLRFADDIDILAVNREGPTEVTCRLNIAARNYGMEISSENSRVMVTSRRNDRTNSIWDSLLPRTCSRMKKSGED